MPDAPGSLRIERDGPVAIFTIDRPHARNALDNATVLALGRAFAGFEADGTARVAVLTGAGGAFCAGADLKAVAGGTDYFPWAGSERGPLRAPLSKPMIAAVAGHAVAGGLGLALFCDIRIAEESAVFGVFCRRFGVPMSDGTTVRLPRIVGLGHALDMLLTGRPVPAREALAIGLVTRVVPDGAARAEAVALAHRLAAFPQIAMNSDRRSAYVALDHDEAEAIRREAAIAAEARRLEAAAGARRFAAGAGKHGAFDGEAGA